MRLSIETMLDYQLTAPADLLLAVEVAQMPDQILVSDQLTVQGVEALTPVAAEEALGRRTWTHAEGRVTVHYRAEVDVDRPAPSLGGLKIDENRHLPALVVPYLFPSRYCEADRFVSLVEREFGDLSGGDQVRAIAAWIGQHLDYVPGASNATTTAADTFIARRGVCRDFAHLMIAMTRAAGKLDRFVDAAIYEDVNAEEAARAIAADVRRLSADLSTIAESVGLLAASCPAPAWAGAIGRQAERMEGIAQ